MGKDACGSAGVLCQYPAWSFAGKHSKNIDPAGPGTGKYNATGTNWNSPSTLMGPPRRSAGPYYSPGNTSGWHKPGGISGERRNPAYSFGAKLPGNPDLTPGPLDYRSQVAWNKNAKQNNTPSWGPPPKYRPATAPRPFLPEAPSKTRAKGPTFGLPHHPIKKMETPGPRSYCDGGCSSCNVYKGPSFGMRPPTIYGQKGGVVGQSPGPQHYHTGCSTLAAATTRCDSRRCVTR